MEAYGIYEQWTKNAKDENVVSMLKEMSSSPEKIEDAFFKELRFGTGGLRGKLGAGTNRMNVYTVARATFGLADYILSSGAQKSVAIAYDSRNMSKEFARLTAEVFSSKGIKAWLFDSLMPTPVLSYAVRTLKVGAGVVVTASHNPKEYNGYKVYNEKGCQLTDKAAEAVTKEIEKYGYFNDFTPNAALIESIGEEMLDKFIASVVSCRTAAGGGNMPKIVYTPLNGTGRVPVIKLFEKMGVTDYTIVPEQEYPDGNFTTCPFPNPEEAEALSLAVELAARSGAELVIATDPDADRMGIAVVEKDGSARLFNGNETGVLMENFLLTVKKRSGTLPKNPYIVKTIVTTPLAEAVAGSFGVATKNVLTGFKYIGETIDKETDGNFVFGMEESYGYLVGTHARDKDSVSAVMTVVDAVCYYKSQGLSLKEALEGIYEKFGYYSSALCSKYFEGKSGMEYMAKFMDDLRRAPYESVCGRKVTAVKDYLKGIDGLPLSNVICIDGDDFSLIVRPSGTEPKIKFYVSARGATESAADNLCEEIKGFVKKVLG